MSNAEIISIVVKRQRFDLTEDPQAAIRFASQHAESWVEMRITSPDRGKTIYASAEPNQDWWKSHGRGEILRGFEEAARRDTDPTTGYRVHSASEGRFTVSG